MRIDEQERDVLQKILAYGGPNLSRNLEMWGEWLKDLERAKTNRQIFPQIPLVMLSLMGIYGRDVLNPPRTKP